MKKRKRQLTNKRKRFLIANAFLVLFFFIGIGYSVLSTNLKIVGDVTVKAPTLYNVLKKEAVNGGLAKEYTGAHQDSIDASKSTEKIYHWYATNDTEGNQILNKNNVIFADKCWQMIRTTDTGGVKMLYNGEAVDNKCLDNRDSHVGYLETEDDTFLDSYYYSTDYIYDSANGVFKLSGDLSQSVLNEDTASNLIGKYTCKSISADDTCSNLYLITDYLNGNDAVTTIMSSEASYDSIGNAGFNHEYDSLSSVGYMYNESINKVEKSMITSLSTNISSSSFKSTYYYADSYQLVNGWYTLVDPYLVTEDDYANMAGKYTLGKTSATGGSTTLQYITEVNNSSYYYLKLTTPQVESDVVQHYTFGTNYVKNGDMYELENPITVSSNNWIAMKDSVGNYFCLGEDSSCERLFYAHTKANSRIQYNIVGEEDYLYGNTVYYNGSNYELRNTIHFYDWNNHYTELSSHHYTCFNTSGVCDKVYYVFYAANAVADYVPLSNGDDLDDYLDKMLWNQNINKNDSLMKVAIESWFKKYMDNYSNYLEDVIYCNNRSVNNYSYWNPDSGPIRNVGLMFLEYINKDSFACPRATDSFSISNENAKLKYPVGLPTISEMYALNNNKARTSSDMYWLMSPYKYSDLFAIGGKMSGSGAVSNDNMYIKSSGISIRPMISLRPGVVHSSGDGSKDNPYIVSTD